jgi:hypothetical protein
MRIDRAGLDHYRECVGMDLIYQAIRSVFARVLGLRESNRARLKREERVFREQITQFRASDRLARNDVQRRDA